MCSCCLVISKWNHKYFKSYLKLKYIIKHVIPNCNLCFYYELGTYVKKKRTVLKQNAHHFIFFSIFLECEKLDWDLRPNPSPLYRMHIQTIIHSDALLLERILSKIENTQNLSWNIWVHRFSENTRVTAVYILWLIVWCFPKKKVLVERIQVCWWHLPFGLRWKHTSIAMSLGILIVVFASFGFITTHAGKSELKH